MSRIVVAAVLAILGLCSASPASDEACQNFLKDSKFDSSVLDGLTWTAVYFWPSNTDSSMIVVEFRALSAEQVTAYKNEISSIYSTISWEKVNYSFSMLDDRIKKSTLLLEIKDDTGYVKAIPADELFNALKTSGRAAVTFKFAFKQVGDYLAVKFCEEWREDGYLLHKGMEYDAADVERAASSIASTISGKQGALAFFLQPRPEETCDATENVHLHEVDDYNKI